jgi:hypothetical protein
MIAIDFTAEIADSDPNEVPASESIVSKHEKLQGGAIKPPSKHTTSYT